MLAGTEGYDGELAFLEGTLNSLKAALVTLQTQGGTRPGQWTLEDIKTRYGTILSRLSALRVGISGREMPSAFMLRLSNFSDAAIKFGAAVAKTANTVVSAAGSVAQGLGTTGKFLPFILIGALVVLGIGFNKGSLGVTVRR